MFCGDYMKKLALYYTLVGEITWSCLHYFNQPFAEDLGFTEVDQSWLFGILYLASSIVVFVLVENEHLLTREKVYLGFPIVMSFSLLPEILASKL